MFRPASLSKRIRGARKTEKNVCKPSSVLRLPPAVLPTNVCDIRRKNVNRRNISRIAIVSYSEDDMFVFLG